MLSEPRIESRRPLRRRARGIEGFANHGKLKLMSLFRGLLMGQYNEQDRGQP
jgi:hypothetical protein